MKDFTIRELQTNLPWTIRYSQDFRATPMSHKDFAHTLHHVSKAAGKLHGLADDMDHDRAVADTSSLREDYGKYVADLVVCALRLANTFPGGVLDLQAATQERIEGKNDTSLKNDKTVTWEFNPYEVQKADLDATAIAVSMKEDAECLFRNAAHVKNGGWLETSSQLYAIAQRLENGYAK